MSALDPPPGDPRARPDEDQREAPSAIIYACHSLVKWHLLLGMFCLIVAGLVPWRVYQFSEYVRLVNKANGIPETTVSDSIAAFAGVCGLLALLNAVVLFRCSNGLRTFAANRKIAALHRAMRRLRTMWRGFSISLAIVVFT